MTILTVSAVRRVSRWVIASLWSFADTGASEMALSFQSLSFDPGTRQVSRDSKEIHLTRKAFDLLALLIERRPEVVAKDEIHARLWPATFVSGNHSAQSRVRDPPGPRRQCE